LLRSIPGKDSLRLCSGSIVAARVRKFQAVALGGNSDVVLVGDSASGLPAFVLRALHASIALARQLLLTFAKEAAASESFSFSAYPQIFGADGVGEGVASGLLSGIIGGEEDAESDEWDEGGGVKGVRGEGGTSMEL
jgi:hypothetical protein